ncbi:TIGR03758 family integrating conjugative element protein [Duffyella gerundensis]|uniref:TIGR03758 family integrating conjugative element protein n=1 Tax=Duffyella gerundensis TaxID=1619313 RepID=UPI003FD02AAB
MAMTQAQVTAFKAASGDLDPAAMHLLWLGLLFATLFSWVAWAAIDLYSGWANQRVRESAVKSLLIRGVVLVVISIWMFGS